MLERVHEVQDVPCAANVEFFLEESDEGLGGQCGGQLLELQQRLAWLDEQEEKEEEDVGERGTRVELG